MAPIAAVAANRAHHVAEGYCRRYLATARCRSMRSEPPAAASEAQSRQACADHRQRGRFGHCCWGKVGEGEDQVIVVKVRTLRARPVFPPNECNGRRTCGGERCHSCCWQRANREVREIGRIERVIITSRVRDVGKEGGAGRPVVETKLL